MVEYNITFHKEIGINAHIESLARDLSKIRIPYESLACELLFIGNSDDTSGNQNHATNHGATLTTDRFGNTNDAYVFDGTDDYMDIADNINLNLMTVTKRVFSFYVKPNNTASKQLIWAEHSVNTENILDGFFIYLDTNRIYFTYVSNNKLVGSCSADFTFADWTHVMCVFDSINKYQSIIINGDVVSTDNKSTPVFPHGGYIGIGYNREGKVMLANGTIDTTAMWYNGALDDIRVYNDVFSGGDGLLKLGYNQTSGYRISEPIDLSSIRSYKSSIISWNGEAHNQTILVETSLDNGATWNVATNGGSISGLVYGDNLEGKSLLIKESLSTTDASISPELYDLNVYIDSNEFIHSSSYIVQQGNDLIYGLLHYWRFNKSLGGIITDEFGDTNGTVYGKSMAMTYGEGGIKIVNDDFVFNSIDSGLKTYNSTVPELIGNYSLSFWLYPTVGSTTRQNIIHKAYGGEGAVVLETDGKLKYYYGTSGTDEQPYQVCTTVKSIQKNKWSHVCIVRDLTNMKIYLYINGRLDSSFTAIYVSATPSSSDILIGYGPEGYYKGKMNSILIFNIPLNSSQVKTIASHQPRNSYTPIYEGLVLQLNGKDTINME